MSPYALVVYNAATSRRLIHKLILGIIAMLFFKCTATLFNSAHRRGERVKWGIVSYIAVMTHDDS